MNEMEDQSSAKRFKAEIQSKDTRTNIDKIVTRIDDEESELIKEPVNNPIANVVREEALKNKEDKESLKPVDEAEQVLPSTYYSSFYDNVSSEELQKLKEFQVLDELDDQDSKDEDSDISDKSDEIPEDEVEKILDDDMPESCEAPPETENKPHINKIILEVKGDNPFDVLPIDWIVVRHYSGMPVYVHSSTRVCTISKPYYLGKENIRKHDIPISAIPCLAYRKALEEEEKQKEISVNNAKETTQPDQTNTQTGNNKEPDALECSSLLSGEIESNSATVPKFQTDNNDVSNTNAATETPAESNNVATINSNRSESDFPRDAAKPVVPPEGHVMPPLRVETVKTSWKTQNLTPDQVNEYCKKLFKFKTVETKPVKFFKRWADRRKYERSRKGLPNPTLPEGTKLITIPAPIADGQEHIGKSKRDWVLTLNEPNNLLILHEYVRRVFNKPVVYEFKLVENPAGPHQATLRIGGKQYGVGFGSNKRQAKLVAARAAMYILMPEMRDTLDEQNPDAETKQGSDYSFFDAVEVEDPRIQELSMTTSDPLPQAVLQNCLTRNFSVADRHIHTEFEEVEFQKIKLTMNVGKHTATVVCKSKKSAKHRAAQAILQQLHPHIHSWGSMLRLYASESIKSYKETKSEERKITLLKGKAKKNQPNYAVLEKLRSEMLKLKERDEAVAPIGTLLVPEDLPTYSGFMLNNVQM